MIQLLENELLHLEENYDEGENYYEGLKDGLTIAVSILKTFQSSIYSSIANKHQGFDEEFLKGRELSLKWMLEILESKNSDSNNKQGA